MRRRKITDHNAGASSVERASAEITSLRLWFPALWFIGFWFAALLLFAFGPIVYDKLATGTWAYLLSSLALFAFLYMQAASPHAAHRALVEDEDSPETAWAWLRWLAPASFLGTLGLVLDRMLFAGASITKTLTDTMSVREEATATTVLTTVSVAPHAFFVTALALYFHLAAVRRRVPAWTHLLIWSMLGLLCLNTVLMAKRGGVAWVAIYSLYFLLFVKGETLKTLLVSRRYLVPRAGLLLFLTAMFVYFNYITAHRNDARFLDRVGAEYMQRDRYGLFNRSQSPASLAALLHLMDYGTHTLPTINAICSRAPWINWDPIFLLGGRTLDQIRKLYPDYETESEQLVDQWRHEGGVSLAAWPTLFGWNAAQFGVAGGVLYLGLLGFLLGWTSRRYLYGGSVGALVLNFSLFLVLCNSFNGNGGDIPHNVAFVLGAYMMLFPRNPLEHQPVEDATLPRDRCRYRRGRRASAAAGKFAVSNRRASMAKPEQTHGNTLLG